MDDTTNYACIGVLYFYDEEEQTRCGAQWMDGRNGSMNERMGLIDWQI